MNHGATRTERSGSFLVRRPTGRFGRWEYATGRYRTIRLGSRSSYSGPEWTTRRSRAGRWVSRGAARRWVRRMTPYEARAVEVVRIATAAGPPAEIDPWDLPASYQRTFTFMKENAS